MDPRVNPEDDAGNRGLCFQPLWPPATRACEAAIQLYQVPMHTTCAPSSDNPRADNLFAIIDALQKALGVELEVKAVA